MNESSPQPANAKLAAAMLVLLLAAFGAGIYLLFTLRFAAGDVFPPYSSLRADPLGAKAFYQALDRLPGITARRNYRELARLRDGGEKTVFLAGTPTGFLADPDPEAVDELAALAGAGNRVVLAFLPVPRDEGCGCGGQKGTDGTKPPQPGDGGKPAPGGNNRPPIDPKGKKAAERPAAALKWGVEPRFAPAGPENAPTDIEAQPAGGVTTLPSAVPVHTALFFDVKDPRWETVYAVAGMPVVISRPVGKGSIVLVADSYLLSNEALRGARRPAYLAWLTGANREVVFDEAHLGVVENPGVMTLVRKYRLQPFLAGLLLVAGLFVWQSAVPLVPAGEAVTVKNPGGGERSHFSGLVNLLRRSIAPERLLALCLQEWDKAFHREYRGAPESLQRIRKVVAQHEARPAAKRDPVADYRKIMEIIAERKRT